MRRNPQSTILLATAGAVLLARAAWPARCAAQAVPSGTIAAPATTSTAGSSGPSVGFSLPTVGGSLQYALTASELFSTGYYSSSGFNAFTNISGNAAYVTRSELHPFSVIYTGGYYFSTTNAPSSFYQSLSFSQVLSTRRWSIVASDSVNYLPSNPSLGLSGVPGVGDLTVPPAQVGVGSGLGLLTTYGPRVNNVASLGVSRQLTGHLSVQGSGSVSILRYVGDNSQFGLNSTGYSGSGGATYAFNARSSMNLNYGYSHYFYTGTPIAFDTHSGTVGYSRQLRRNLSFSAYAGPQVVVSTQPGLTYGGGIGVTAGAFLGYQAGRLRYALGYSHGISGGSGVIPGAVLDSVNLTAARQFGLKWNASGSLGFSHNQALQQLGYNQFTGNSLALGLQVNRSLTRTVSAFGSYSVIRQGIAGSAPVNTFSGLYQVIGVGLTYSPRPLVLSR